MKIQFVEKCWVLKKETTCGFIGSTSVVASFIINEEPFDILSISKDKNKQCSDIHIWSDGHVDGDNLWLINVPNGMFKQVND